MALVCMAILLTGCGSEDAAKTEQGSSPQQEEDSAITVTVNSTSSTTEDEWGELKEGHELVVVDITVTNNSGEPYEFNPNHLQLQQDNKNILVSDKRPKGKEVLNLFTIEHGKNLTGIVCFDVPIGAEYTLYYDDFKNRIKLK